MQRTLSDISNVSPDINQKFSLMSWKLLDNHRKYEKKSLKQSKKFKISFNEQVPVTKKSLSIAHNQVLLSFSRDTSIASLDIKQKCFLIFLKL